MRIKSYFASTIEAALDLARRELGEEAVLLNSRPAPPEARHLGIHEVVFGVEREHDPELRPAAAMVTLRPPPHDSPPRATEWEAVRRQVERLEKTITDHVLRPPSRTSALSQFLVERDFPEPLAGELAFQVEELLASGGVESPFPASFQEPERRRAGGFRWEPGAASAEFRERGVVAEFLLGALGERLAAHCQPLNGMPGRVLAFCGPPGGGKTTLLAKLAAVFSVERQESVTILSTDTLRISAAEQLRTYASIMGLSCEVVETPERLAQALAQALAEQANREQAKRRWILIDTPGWAPAQLAQASVWASFFAARPEIEQHLVLPAYMTVSQVEAAVQRFRPFGVARLALTRADEIRAGGGLIAAILASGLPVSYLGTGQSVPEDVEEARLERLLDLACADQSFLAAACAASIPEPARSGDDHFSHYFGDTRDATYRGAHGATHGPTHGATHGATRNASTSAHAG